MKTIYFAGAISGGRHDQEIYQLIVLLLREYGIVRTEHVADPNLTADGESRHPAEIHDGDIGWLKEADLVVAEVSSPSLGIGYELGRAVGWGKKILALFQSDSDKRLSPMITENSGITVRGYKDLVDLRLILKEFF